MKIGSITLDNKMVLAPLAGITNLPFRLIAKESGCALVCSEMISANGLIHGSKKTMRMLDSSPQEKPLSIQIFGSDPVIMANAAKIVMLKGADILDINFGCSVKKVVKTGAGAALMKSMEKSETILKSVRDAISIPVTIKIRTGWNPNGMQALKLAELAEICGINAIAVHPRTATQGFKGKSDWSIIEKIKRNISIPVIGNGDILSPSDAMDMLNQTGCDAIMIGRSAIGAPWIFDQVGSLLKGEDVRPVDLSYRFKTMCRYLESSVSYMGEGPACQMMRSRLGWFVKGLYGSSKFRESIKHVSSEKEALEKIDLYKNFLFAYHMELEGEKTV